MNELTEILSERLLVAFVLVVRCEMFLTFTYRNPRVLVDFPWNFHCFRPNPNPLYGPYYSYLPVKNEVWKDVDEKLDRHSKLYLMESNADIAPT